VNNEFQNNLLGHFAFGGNDHRSDGHYRLRLTARKQFQQQESQEE